MVYFTINVVKRALLNGIAVAARAVDQYQADHPSQSLPAKHTTLARDVLKGVCCACGQPTFLFILIQHREDCRASFREEVKGLLAGHSPAAAKYKRQLNVLLDTKHQVQG